MGSEIYETGSYLGVLIFGAVLHGVISAVFAALWYALGLHEHEHELSQLSRKRIEYRQIISAACCAANFIMMLTSVVMIANIGKVDRSSESSTRRVDVAYFIGSALASVFCMLAATTFYRTRTMFITVCIALLWIFGFTGLSVAPLSAQLDKRNWCIAVSAFLLLMGDVLMVLFGWAWRHTWLRRLALWLSLVIFVAVQIAICAVLGISRDNEPRKGLTLRFRWQSQLAYTFFAFVLLCLEPLFWLYAVIAKADDVPISVPVLPPHDNLLHTIVSAATPTDQQALDAIDDAITTTPSSD